ncbi:MAG: OsmC family protein [Gemmatimonadales bacterium]
MDRIGTARWEGDLVHGNGNLRTGSGALTAAYSFGTRFENAPGTNPEELIAAAHAACFSMAFAAGLAKAGHAPRSVDTTATVRLEKSGDGFAITGITLDTKVDVADLAKDEIARIAEETKRGCPVSKALAAVPIELKLS